MSEQTLPSSARDELYAEIRRILVASRQHARQAVNEAMVQAYWQIGRLIVEDEQGGKQRADYGKKTLNEVAKRLTAEFGRGFSLANLRNFRQFYLAFPAEEIRYTLCSKLSWSHFRELMRVAKPEARLWYAQEAAAQGWSVRALDRQIGTLFYERLLLSQDKDETRREAVARIAEEAPPDPREFIRDPYVLEFLELQPSPLLYEKDVEHGLIDRLQHFLLELGRGFAFVARQKRLHAEGDDFFVDLVFYNYLLKCFVLIDLKVGRLTHQDVGQMDMYVRLCDEQMRGSGDNPSIGLILCSERNAAVAKYSQLASSAQLFASQYRLILPSEDELRAELERDRALLEAAHQGEEQ
ncbi:PDDEXK nuclease domain-containing protein [Rhodocyclus purpureus]|uniref:PDDEXK nuclease domain-containing protein n=1 Tax=Rhodocyclus purpureus TaxID=1067 RepID=UPI0019125FCF|nr:PDDEXK nuclease domain-containing protein [Rhodocyclus purpureus]MBK5914069.1 hypothetical protein [Rhodocyclus purpureus]